MKKTLLSIALLSFLLLYSCIKDDIVYPSESLVSTKICKSTPSDPSSEIFKVVENNPAFPGCEDVLDKTEKKKCAEEKMLDFIYGNLVYPLEAKQKGIEGTVVVSFVVENDGCISGIKVVKDIGGGCGQEAIRICEMMPEWEPGRQRDNLVRVQFNLPVKFEL